MEPFDAAKEEEQAQRFLHDIRKTPIKWVPEFENVGRNTPIYSDKMPGRLDDEVQPDVVAE